MTQHGNLYSDLHMTQFKLGDTNRKGEGFKTTGEYRTPNAGEFFAASPRKGGAVWMATGDLRPEYYIVELAIVFAEEQEKTIKIIKTFINKNYSLFSEKIKVSSAEGLAKINYSSGGEERLITVDREGNIV